MKKCMNCGYMTMNDTERFCTKCGTQLQLIKMAAPQQNIGNVNVQGQPQQNMGNVNMQGQPQQNIGNVNMQGQPQQNMGNPNMQRQPQQNMGNPNMQGQPQQNMGNINMQGQPRQNMGNINMQGQPQQNVNPNGQIINRENLNAAVDAKLNAVKAGVSKAAQKAGVSADDVKIKAEKAKAKAEEVSKKLPFKINKRNIIIGAASIFVVFILIFALTANRRSCKKEVNNMIDRLIDYEVKTGADSLAEGMNISDETAEKIGLSNLIEAYREPFSYRIKNVKIDGDNAKVEVSLKNKLIDGKSFNDVLKKAVGGEIEKTLTDELISGNGKSAMKELSKKISKIRNDDENETYDGVVRLEKKYGDWCVVSVNEDVIRGYSGIDKDYDVSAPSDVEKIVGEVKDND